MGNQPARSCESSEQKQLANEFPSAQVIKSAIATHVRAIMNILCIKETDSTIGTPDRVAKMYFDEIFCGLNELPPKIMTQENSAGYDQMILQKRITVKSTCEHHLVPIIGHCHIAYIPDEKLIGLSKMNRIVEHFSRRPQVQENLTHDIINHLRGVLWTDNVAVCLDLEHFCIKLRGVNHNESLTRTSALSGKFMNDSAARKEFFDGIS